MAATADDLRQRMEHIERLLPEKERSTDVSLALNQVQSEMSKILQKNRRWSETKEPS